MAANNNKTETTSVKSTVVEQPKKKSNILGIILGVILALCALVSVIGYWAFNKAKDVVEYGIDEVETAVEDYDTALGESAEEFEQIQKEIREATEQATSGEISQEEFQIKLRELNARSLELLRESNE